MNIQIYYTLARGGGDGESSPLKRRLPQNTLDLRKGLERKRNAVQKSCKYITFTIYRHVASAGAVTMVTARVKRRAQRPPSIVHAVAVRI